MPSPENAAAPNLAPPRPGAHGTPGPGGHEELAPALSSAQVWAGATIWTVLLIAGEYAAHGGAVENIPLTEFVVLVGSWLAGVTLLAFAYTRLKRLDAAHARRLHLRERQWRGIYAQCPVAVHTIDADGAIVAVNDAWRSLFGYSNGEVVGRSIEDVLGVGHAPNNGERLARLAGIGQTRAPELVCRHKSGREIRVAVYGHAIADEQGRLQSAHCALHDITERSSMEEELRLREESYRQLFEGSPNAMVVYELPSLRILAANDAARHQYGYSLEEFLGLTLRELHVEEEVPGMERTVGAPRPSLAFSGPWRHRRKNGDEIRVEVSSQSVQWQGCQARCVVFTDITERQRLAAVVQEQAESYRALLGTALDAVIELDEEGRVREATPLFSKLTGYNLAELAGRPISDVEAQLSPDEVQSQLAQIRQRGSLTFETKLRHRSGSVVDFEISATYVPARRRVVAFLREISSRKRVEGRLRMTNTRLEALVTNLKVGVLVEDSERLIAVANSEFCRIFGAASDPAILEGHDGAAAARRAAPLFAKPDVFLARIDELVSRRQPCTSEVIDLADGRVLERDYVPITIDGTGQGHLWVFRDVTDRRRIQQALEKRLVALTSPIETDGGVDFEELFNLEDIQKLQDQFSRATEVASLITRPDGTPLTRPSNFTKFCASIRGTEKGRCHCMRSDAIIGGRNADGPIIQPCLSGGLWDAGASIVVGGRHVANWLIGQVRNETQDESQIREYARQIGADESSIVEAFRQVPCMSRERFGEISQTLFTLAQQLSTMAYQNVQQARFITERDRAEQELRTSEERFREAIAHAGAGYFRIDRDGRYEAVNSAWLRMHGFDDESQVVGQPFALTQTPDGSAAAVALLAEAFTGESIPTGEFTRRLRDGSTGYHTFSVHPVKDGSGVVAVEGFLIDTTPLKRAMADYKMLFDTMLDGFALHQVVRDASGGMVDLRYLAVNPAFERMTGLKASQVMGRSMSEMLTGLEPRWLERYRQAADSGEPIEFEDKTEGLARTFKVSAFTPSSGQLACVFVDVTERNRAEDALRKLSRAVEQSPVSVVITDPQEGIEYVNPCFTQTTGYTLEEVQGRNLHLLSAGDTPESVWAELAATMAGGREWRGEFHNRKKSGELFWEAATIAPIFDDAGLLTHYISVTVDITSRKRTDAALAASEQRFRSLVESVPNIAVQGYDENRRVVFWNTASERLYGYTAHEALGRPLEDLIIPEVMREGVIAAVEGFIRRNVPIPAGELQLRHKAGNAVSVYSSHVKLDRGDGQAEMYCIDIDLSARKEAERALAESYDFHLRLLSQAPALIWRSNTSGELDWFNGTWLAFTGRTMEAEQGEGWADGVHPDDLVEWAAVYAEAFATRRPFVREYRLRRHDGEYRWVSDSGIPFDTPSRQFGGFIGYCIDITDRRLAEQQIREQAALLDVTQDAIVVTTLDGLVSYWNRSAERLYEVPAAQARGRSLVELVYGARPPSDFHENWSKILTSNGWAGDRKVTLPSGRSLDVRVRCTLLRNAAGEPHSVLIVITDVTESRLLEKQFLRAQRLESLGALASGVAHDLNNVLTPILMSVELLRPLAQAKHDQDMLQLLSDSARRGSDIVQQLLLFGRGSDTPRSPLNAGSIVKDVGRMMRETFPKKITLSVQAPADLWLIDADRTQIHQVVLNLCVNARDAMPQGGRLAVSAENVHVDARFAQTHSGKRAGPHVRIRVQDTGSGIAPDILDKIFDPFFTTKPVGEGTGLGLATVLGIVRSHEGLVDVKSTLGQGSMFDIYLPAEVAGTLPVAPPGPGAALRGNGELVLVIEDEEGIRSLLQRALTSHNYQVLIASDGVEALGVYAQNVGRVKLVVTDAMMPVMDGPQTIRALRRLNPALPVVAISGLPVQRAELEKNAGPQIRFLPKPFATDHALRVIREALDEASGVAKLPASR